MQIYFMTVLNKNHIVSFIFSLCALISFAQKPASEDIGFVYSKEFSGGIQFHTAGWGLQLRYASAKTYKHKFTYNLELVTIKHPKQVKVKNPLYDNAKSYYYGKLNVLMPLRLSIGYRKILFEKKRENGVEISYLGQIGPSLGILKPVYLQIIKPTEIGTIVVEEKYDPNQHHEGNIYGRVGFMKGLGESKIYPGLFTKAGLLFEYSGEEDGIKAIEVGATLDLYTQKTPILANELNKNIHFNLYLSFLFGRKYF
jgi:hypothetical protein